MKMGDTGNQFVLKKLAFVGFLKFWILSSSKMDEIQIKD